MTKACRGTVSGDTLMTGAKKICRCQRTLEIIWSVHKRNASAHPFYERLGGKHITDEELI